MKPIPAAAATVSQLSCTRPLQEGPAGPLPHAPEAIRSLPTFVWTREASAEFWRKLSDSRYLSDKAFSRIVGGQLLHKLRDILPAEGRVLDFGSGAHGYLAHHLLNHGYKTATYEPGRGARAKYAFASHPRYLGEWPVDASDEREKFDIIFLCEVVEHLFEEDFPDVIVRIRRALKPGGMLIVTTPNREDLVGNSIFNPVTGELFHPWQHVRSWTPESLVAMVTGFGFEVQVVHETDFGRAGEFMDQVARYQATVDALTGIVASLCESVESGHPVEVAAIRQKAEADTADCLRTPALSGTKNSYSGDGTNLVAVFRAVEGG